MNAKKSMGGDGSTQASASGVGLLLFFASLFIIPLFFLCFLFFFFFFFIFFLSSELQGLEAIFPKVIERRILAARGRGSWAALL